MVKFWLAQRTKKGAGRMNPITYCAVTSCSEKDWEVFGAIALITLIGLFVVGVVVWLTDKFGKDSDMK